jgi:hypothetical protein
MSRNVDIVAVGALLAGIAVYSHTRNLVVNAMNAHHIGFIHSSHVVVVPVAPTPPLPDLPVRIMRD